MALSDEAAVGLVGLAGFQVWQAWRDTAPSFLQLRQASPGDYAMRQALLDSTLAVGTLALGLGIALSIISHNSTGLYLMLGIYGALAFWSYQILAAEKVA